MRKSLIAGLALWAAFAAFAGKAHAEVNYPWCLMGDTRGYECVFSSREQCMQDGRNRGFGSQCIQNPYYKPGAPIVSGQKPSVSQSTRPSPAVSSAQSTCTGLRSVCLSGGDCSHSSLFVCGGRFCNTEWEHCMKTGFWEGAFLHRPAERR
jgi:Protein of unknown function (DUF3551)